MEGTPHVLLVTSDEALRTRMARALAAWGYEPSEATDLAGALAQARTAVPNVVVVDQRAGAATGVEVVRALRAASQDALQRLPIVALVPSGEEQRLMHAGASCVVRPPLSVRKVLEAVRWAVSVYANPK